MLKPLHNVSVYGNWIQGLRQGTVVGANFTNAGEILPPFKTNQYEAGIKVDWGTLHDDGQPVPDHAAQPDHQRRRNNTLPWPASSATRGWS